MYVVYKKKTKKLSNHQQFLTSKGESAEVVNSFKCLWVLIDNFLLNLTLTTLLEKLKLVFFFFRNKPCFSFNVSARLVFATYTLL